MMAVRRLTSVVTTATMLLMLVTAASAFTVATIKQPHSLVSTQRYHHYRYERRTYIRSRLCMNSNSFMDRLPNESDDAYFRRIVAAASNAQSFETAVLKPSSNYQTPPTTATNSTESTTNSTGTSGTSKYVRAEVWEEQEREKAKSLNWEERVQFDGQVHGNRFNQNEILRHNLKGF